jgi:hypothetical protein
MFAPPVLTAQVATRNHHELRSRIAGASMDFVPVILPRWGGQVDYAAISLIRLLNSTRSG